MGKAHPGVVNMMIDAREVKKIMIIKLGGMGDVFLSTIVIESLRQHFRDAKIDYFVERAGREAIAHDPRIHSIFTLDKKIMNPFSVILQVRQKRYDMVIDLFGNPRSAIITLLSGARYRVGLDYGWRKYLYSVAGEAKRGQLHGAEVNLQILPAVQVPEYSPKLHFFLSDGDEKLADDFWKNNQLLGKFVIGILPAGSWPSKRCEPGKFAEITSELTKRYHATALVVWGPSDMQDAREICRNVGFTALMGPEATVSQNVSLLSRCTAIIANDSGPMHIASSFDVPILCIYGPTFPEGPYGGLHAWVRNEHLSCLVCNLLECPIQHQCMTELPLQHVVDAFDQMMKKAGSSG